MNLGKKIRVLVVDDSALMRKLITEILESDPGIEVVGTASDPYRARDQIMKLDPDVLTLDVEMPRMDGLTFLARLMKSRPMPVVMFSALTQKGCEITLKAFEIGAVDFVEKPIVDMSLGFVEIGGEIVAKVKAAACANVKRYNSRKEFGSPVQVSKAEPLADATNAVIAIGASTGGTEAVSEVLCALPPDSPGIVAVIHMPRGFTGSFAKRLNERCDLTVTEAQDGDTLLPGHVLLAPGDFHMELVGRRAKHSVKVRPGRRVNQHRPSVNVLFESVARNAGHNAIGVILTGMGDDGADGLLAMHMAGATTIAQDESTCVVFGMPKEAIKRGCIDKVLPKTAIGHSIISCVRKMNANDERKSCHGNSTSFA